MMNTKAPFDENVACDVCGRFGAFNFGGQHLCADCYETKGSCCPEFGADNLWEVPDPADEVKERPLRTDQRVASGSDDRTSGAR